MDNVDPILKRRYYALLIAIMNEKFTIDQAMAWTQAKDTARPKKKKPQETRSRLAVVSRKEPIQI